VNTVIKIVREKYTHKTVYRQLPVFKKGLGIKNACAIFGYRPEELEEVELTRKEYNADLQLESAEIQKERMIRAEMDSILRSQAIQSLIKKGKLAVD
jgi:hypothetical protein